MDYLQLKDGRDKFILNRDDAAGFQLDTTFTHKQYSSLTPTDNPDLMTYTDYVNKYNSVQQTTMHLFMATENTPEMVAGIVKSNYVFAKYPSQNTWPISTT